MIVASSASGDRKLRIAVPKGALFEGSLAALSAAGMDVEGLADPGRQLLVELKDAQIIIAKPSDVPIYVAYGGADCGIAGRDVLVEAATEVAELVDLGFGACRFVVAAPIASDDVLGQFERQGVLRVATKYPGVAQAHFDERGQQVEIVKLYGNIEIAPLIGMADVIVDITATGATLRENGLQVVDEVWPSTARFVGNPVAVRIDPRVAALADMW
ncbi:MAG: ATP phosphoribosyltransferase [Coriobacteriia bacterium]|nr:ATP phosphoribosyltransferase [Coriobacteriia bacterium]